MRGKVDALMGLQRGDEGKGRFIDILAPHYRVIARYNGSANAGHTIVAEGQEISLHQIPSGIMHSHIFNLITHGVLFDPIKFAAERAEVEAAGYSISEENLMIGSNAYVVMPHHILLDKRRENCTDKQQGSTSTGVAYAAGDKYIRHGGNAYLIRKSLKNLGAIAADGLREYNTIVAADQRFKPVDPDETVERWLSQISDAQISKLIGNTDEVVHRTLDGGGHILAEGAQAALLDVTRGRVPLTTSSHTGIAGVMDGLGIGPGEIGKVTGVVKLFPSHVGNGHFISQIEDPKVAQLIRGKRGEPDGEYGKTTQRERRVGWLDMPVLRSAIRANGVTEMLLTKLDVAERLRGIGRLPLVVAYVNGAGERTNTSPIIEDEARELTAAYKYLPLWEGSVKELRLRKDLPEEANELLTFIERETRTPIVAAGVGPGREQYVK